LPSAATDPGSESFASNPELMVNRSCTVICALRSSQFAYCRYVGKNERTVAWTLGISPRSMANPTSAEVTVFEADRISCHVVQSKP
jgi:hypothetical protein